MSTTEKVVSGSRGAICRIVRFGIGSQKIRYADVAQAAQAAGFSDQEIEDYVPRKKGVIMNAQAAFKRVTSFPKRGIKLASPENFQKEILNKFGVSPVIRLRSKDVSKRGSSVQRSVVKRQIVAEITIPFVAESQKGDDARLAQEAKQQFSSQPVWMLEFISDDGSGAPAIEDYRIPFDDPYGLSDEIEKAVSGIIQDIQSWLDCCDDAAIRDGIRSFLDDNHALNEGIGGKGGLYTLPISDEVYHEMRKIKNYIHGLRLFSSADHLQPYLVSNVIYLEGDDFDEENLDQTKTNVIRGYEQKFAQFDEELRAILKDGRRGKAARNTIKRVLGQVLKTQAGINAYKRSLGDDMERLEIKRQILLERIQKAEGMAS